MRPPLQNEHQYAFDQEVQRHDDAVHWFGEMTAFILWWNIHDFEAGRVTRCTVCYTPLGDITDVFRQSPNPKCDSCWGTTFNGGVRAILYRPAIWNTKKNNTSPDHRGEVAKSSGTIQMISSFYAREGDVAVRHDGFRWRMSQAQGPELTTGFGPRDDLDRVVRSKARVTLDDETSPSYGPTIDLSVLGKIGWQPYLDHSPNVNDVFNGPEIVNP